MDEGGAARPHRGQVEPGQQRELLQEDRPLAPGLRLADGQPGVAEGERRLGAGPPGGEVVVAEQAPVGAAGRVHDVGDVQVAGEGLGDEALVEDPPGGLDLLVPAGRGGFGLVEDALVGGGQLRVAEPAARRGHLAARQVHLGGARPVLAEHLRDASDGPAERGHDGVPAAGVADGVAQPRPAGAPTRGRAAAAATRRTPPARRPRAGRCPGSWARRGRRRHRGWRPAGPAPARR